MTMAADKKKKGATSGVEDENLEKKNFPTMEVHASNLNEYNQSGAALDNEILSKAEENYGKIVEKVIDVSKDQLEKEGEKKRGLRSFFTCFFSVFIAVQFVALLVLLLIKGFNENFKISEALLTTYIVSVFVETLGIIAAMVAFIFNAKEEVNIINTLNAAIANYQKLSEKNRKKDNESSKELL